MYIDVCTFVLQYGIKNSYKKEISQILTLAASSFSQVQNLKSQQSFPRVYMCTINPMYIRTMLIQVIKALYVSYFGMAMIHTFIIRSGTCMTVLLS